MRLALLVHSDFYSIRFLCCPKYWFFILALMVTVHLAACFSHSLLPFHSEWHRCIFITYTQSFTLERTTSLPPMLAIAHRWSLHRALCHLQWYIDSWARPRRQSRRWACETNTRRTDVAPCIRWDSSCCCWARPTARQLGFSFSRAEQMHKTEMTPPPTSTKHTVLFTQPPHFLCFRTCQSHTHPVAVVD